MNGIGAALIKHGADEVWAQHIRFERMLSRAIGRVTEDGGMALDLFAGIPVNDYAAALAWYERLLGSPPAFFPHDTEAVWGLADHRWVYVVQRPEHAGHAMLTVMVDDLDDRIAQISDRGIEPATREIYEGGTRKMIYRDPDGNEIGFGGVPPGK